MIFKIFKRAGTLALGTVVGQGIILLATPWLARKYSAVAFGELALLLTVSNIATALACFRYDVAIPAAEERFTRGLIKVCAFCALISAGVALVIIAIAKALHVGIVGAFLASSPGLVAACVFLVGLYQALGVTWLREGRYLHLAMMRASQGGGFVIAASVPGIGLLWAHVVSFCSGLMIVWSGRSITGSATTVGESACLFRSFPLMSLPGAMLDVIGHSCFTWVIIANYGAESAGHYSQVQRLIGSPMMLASLSLGQVLLRQSADIAGHRVAMSANWMRLLLVLGTAAIIGILVIWFVGEPVLGRLLGHGWRVDRGFITVIAVAVFVRACISPLSSALITLQRFDIALLWQGLYFASATLLMPCIARGYQFDNFLRFYALHEIVFYGFYAILIFKAIRA